MYWLGIDTGTGGTRALLVDAKGQEIAACTAPHEPIRMEQPLWAEQHPDNWAAAAIQAVRGVLAQAGAHGKDVRGIGLSGQMHGLVLLDRSHAVIRPALIWCDQRSQPQADFIHRKIGRQRVLECIANPILTGFTLPKLLWVRDREPQNFERLRNILLPKDYIRYQLTGEFATDVSDASGTGLFDVLRRRWSYEMADGLALDRSILPAAYESRDISGVVSARAAKLTGLAAGTPVMGGAGDQAAGAVGNGIVEPGVVSCMLGTSGVVFAHMEDVKYDPHGRIHTFCHAVREKWHVMGVTQGAGLSLQWLRNQLAPDASYDALMAEAGSAPAGSEDLFWLPYLMGERSPHLDPQARGGWVGLTAKHTRAELIRAVIEGVCYSQKDCLELVESLGIGVASVRASGGGARSLLWRRILAGVFGKRVAVMGTQEGSAYGAALIALAGAGEYTNIPEVCRAAVREAESIEPDPADALVYKRGYEIYRSLYPALRPIYARIAKQS